MFSRWFPFIFLFSAGVLIGDIPDDGVIASDMRPWSLAAAEPKTSLTPIYPSPFRNGKKPADDSPLDEEGDDSLLETLEDLSARAGELTEPSRESERQYITAIRKWLLTLEPLKREQARRIMKEAHPELEALRAAIRNKKSQLASISFDRGMPPETLPRLGMELQQLRASLNDELKRLGERLRYEVGVEAGPTKDSFWLSLSQPEH